MKRPGQGSSSRTAFRLLIDWDGTLVDTDQEWKPGAYAALVRLKRQGHSLAVHSSRANSEFGREQIRAKLGPRFANVEILPKPEADLYIDNLGFHFNSSWPEAFDLIKMRLHR